jgi:hypothetical protein
VSTVTVRVPTALRSFSDGQGLVEIDVDYEAPTVETVLDALASVHPGVVERVLD